jgi:dipeptidyl aminopeptidase/acylaminoacyl peptidase
MTLIQQRLRGWKCGAAALLLMWADMAAAGGGTPVLRSRTPCVMPEGNYAEYQTRALQQWQTDDAAAKAAGLRLRPQSQLLPALWTAAEYTERNKYAGMVCERLTYLSDGLEVVAFFWHPKARPAKGKWPLLVFNRGGFGETFKLRPNTWFGFYTYVHAGFAVLGSQYRGNDQGAGQKSPGDGDVRDVLNLFPLAQELGGVDVDRAVMLGFSRGGYVTLRALAAGAPVRAAAVLGATRSLASIAPAAPEMFKAVPVPLLVLHGGADGSVPPAEALEIWRQQIAGGQPAQLHIFDGDSHGVTFSQRERDEEVLAWFARYGVM